MKARVTVHPLVLAALVLFALAGLVAVVANGPGWPVRVALNALSPEKAGRAQEVV